MVGWVGYLGWRSGDDGGVVDAGVFGLSRCGVSW